MFSGERVRNKPTEKIQDPAGIHTQDLLNARSDTLTTKTACMEPLAKKRKTSYISSAAYRPQSNSNFPLFSPHYEAKIEESEKLGWHVTGSRTQDR